MHVSILDLEPQLKQVLVAFFWKVSLFPHVASSCCKIDLQFLEVWRCKNVFEKDVVRGDSKFKLDVILKFELEFSEIEASGYNSIQWWTILYVTDEGNPKKFHLVQVPALT